MNFDEAKYQVVQAIKNKNFRHERRKSQAQKNLLANDEISQAEAIAIIEKTRGNQAVKSEHHFLPDTLVWVFRPDDWYIKFYLANGCFFISFHKSEDRP